MFTYQYIDNLDPAEVKKFQEAYSKAYSNPSHFFQYVETGLTHFMGMQLNKCVLITIAGGKTLPLHIDQRKGLALNIPLLNCEDTITELWTCDQPYKTGWTHNGLPYHYYSENVNAVKIGEFILTRPILFDVQVPHSSTNHGTKTRLAISLRFANDPWQLVNGYAEDLK